MRHVVMQQSNTLGLSRKHGPARASHERDAPAQQERSARLEQTFRADSYNRVAARCMVALAVTETLQSDAASGFSACCNAASNL